MLTDYSPVYIASTYGLHSVHIVMQIRMMSYNNSEK